MISTESAVLGAWTHLDPLVHEPSRLLILTSLMLGEPRECPVLQRLTGLSWGNLSAHLSKLENAGYVNVRKTFKGKRPNSMVVLTDRGRAAFTSWKRHLSQGLRCLDNPRGENLADSRHRRPYLSSFSEPLLLERRFTSRDRTFTSHGGRWLYPLQIPTDNELQPR